MLKKMKSMDLREKHKILLLGNGINRAFKYVEWDKLLKDISPNKYSEEEWEAMGKMPYPLLAVAVAGDELGATMKSKADELIEMSVPDEEKEIIRQLINNNFDAILTTNYTYEIEQALSDDFHIKKGRSSKYRKKTCDNKGKSITQALYEYMDIENDEIDIPVWHIHGEAAKPDTMIIGHYYYGNMICNIKKHIADNIKRYKYAVKEQKFYQPKSWVDYFLYSDVYIVGQGMDMSEMDLWWLVNSKKRNGKGKVYYFEPNISFEKKKLAEAYEVEVINLEVNENNYREYYRNVAKFISNEMI